MKIVAVYLLFISASSGYTFFYPVYFRKASPERLFSGFLILGIKS